MFLIQTKEKEIKYAQGYWLIINLKDLKDEDLNNGDVIYSLNSIFKYVNVINVKLNIKLNLYY